MPKLTIEQYNLKHGITPPKNCQDFTTNKKWTEPETEHLFGFLRQRSLEAVIRKLRRLHREHAVNNSTYNNNRHTKIK